MLNLISTMETNNKEAVAAKFLALETREDIAILLNINLKTLNYYLYKLKPEAQYESFQIQKRSGGIREIHSPISKIKEIQRNLNNILHIIYKVKPSAHGFIIKKNIVSNAKPHVGKRYVFNLDLKDFFPTIHFGRVRGMFQGKPHYLPKNIAIILAQICCYKGYLPQGAPTSPIISNMICSQLDSQLQQLAASNYCSYTRYADDMTFSTNRKIIPPEIVEKRNGDVRVGNELEKIIERSGFKINREKVRLQERSMRQEVTGLTVNVHPNVTRKYVRQIRAMLHAWDKYKYKLAEKEYWEKYRHKKGNASFKKVVKGKINFLKMVKGEDDEIYMKFVNKFCKLTGRPEPYFIDPLKKLQAGLWIIEATDDESISNKMVFQGTAFMLRHYGLITAYHVLGKSNHAYRSDNVNKKYPVTIRKSNKHFDLAILDVKVDNPFSFDADMNFRLETGDRVTYAGFPQYDSGNTPNRVDAKITSQNIRSAIKFYNIDKIIIAGASGSPVFSRSNKVIGVAVKGARNLKEALETPYHSFIEINNLRNLTEN